MGQQSPLIPMQPKVDMSRAKKLRCKTKGCGSEFFVQVFRLKSISAILHPTGKTANYHFPVWVCSICGKEKELPK